MILLPMPRWRMSSGWTGCGSHGMCTTGRPRTPWSSRRAANTHGPAHGTAASRVIANAARVTHFQIMPYGRRGPMPPVVPVPITPPAAEKHQRPVHAISKECWRAVIVSIAGVSEVRLPIGRRIARRGITRWRIARRRISRIGIRARRWRHDAAAQSQQNGRERETMMHRASPVRKINKRSGRHRHRSRR